MQLVALGAGLAGLAAGAYFFLGPKGEKHQRQAKAWADKMKTDVIEKLKTVSDISEATYNEIIDTVAKEYEKDMSLAKSEIKALAKDLKKHWKSISKSVMEMQKKREKELAS